MVLRGAKRDGDSGIVTAETRSAIYGILDSQIHDVSPSYSYFLAGKKIFDTETTLSRTPRSSADLSGFICSCRHTGPEEHGDQRVLMTEERSKCKCW